LNYSELQQYEGEKQQQYSIVTYTMLAMNDRPKNGWLFFNKFMACVKNSNIKRRIQQGKREGIYVSAIDYVFFNIITILCNEEH
jgi:hypothetical protein